jgi:hypothetical protein
MNRASSREFARRRRMGNLDGESGSVGRNGQGGDAAGRGHVLAVSRRFYLGAYWGSRTAVFRAVVEKWNTDWAVFTTDEIADMQGDFTGQPFAGWITYLKAAPASIPSGENGVDVAPMEKGTLVIAGPDPLQVAANQIQEAAAYLRGMRETGSWLPSSLPPSTSVLV